MQERRLIAWFLYGLIGVLVTTPVLIWWRSVGDPSVYFTQDMPPGQGLYAFAKLAGLLGLALFWVQALLGMAPRVPLFSAALTISRTAHIRLGLITAALISAHILLFVIGSSFRKKTVAWDLLLPNFDHGYYFQSITWGAFALYLMIVALFGGWRVRRGHRAWKPVHMLWVAVFAFALLHSLAIGSESRNGVLVYVFFFMGSSMALIAMSRAFVWLKTRKRKNAVAIDNKTLVSGSTPH